MDIPSPVIGVYSAVLHQKVCARKSCLEGAYPDYPTRYNALSEIEREHYNGFEIAEMQAVYAKWSGKSSAEPEDWFPAYVRLCRMEELIDLGQKEIPLIDSKKHMFLNDLEFVCFADLTKLLTKQGVLDLLGIKLKVVPGS